MSSNSLKVQSKRVDITDEIRQAVLDQLEKGTYYGGEQCYRFEREMADYLGAKYVVTVNSGTSAMFVAMGAFGIAPGDDVLVPANVYVSSAEVATFFGGRPVFSDVEPGTGLVTVETLAARVTPKTKAIILTHLWGHPVDMDPVMEFARSRGIKVLEVCAHALGSEYKGRRTGALADMAMFSLGSKNISVCGTGGAIATNSRELYDEAAMVSRHGWRRLEYDQSFWDGVTFEDSPNDGMFPVGREASERPGLNLQLDEIFCAIGRVNLKYLETWNDRRREAAALYTRLIKEASLPVATPVIRPWAKHSFLHYVIRTPERDGLRRHLVESRIEALVHYLTPLPTMPYYKKNYPTSPEVYPVTAKLATEIMTLPIHPWISDEEVAYVVEKIGDFYKSR